MVLHLVMLQPQEVLVVVVEDVLHQQMEQLELAVKEMLVVMHPHPEEVVEVLVLLETMQVVELLDLVDLVNQLILQVLEADLQLVVAVVVNLLV